MAVRPDNSASRGGRREVVLPYLERRVPVVADGRVDPSSEPAR